MMLHCRMHSLHRGYAPTYTGRRVNGLHPYTYKTHRDINSENQNSNHEFMYELRFTHIQKQQNSHGYV